MLHTFVALVEDKPGVLTRVASLFRRLNVNIVSLTVGRSERPGVSRMTIVALSSTSAGHRIVASLYKLENVLEVDDMDQVANVSRELALIKVGATPQTRSHIFELVEVFRARIVDLAPESLMIEITGVESKIEGLIQVLIESGDPILEVSRTGRMVMRRGHHTSRVLEAMRVATASENETKNAAVFDLVEEESNFQK
ncbi:acetolactate synthase small subunit [Acidobacterium sp. S8]|uniref:acetolactate synthase small subunit n=1 Tax=Acidobacterium sp. S8 TaxID=1641854 RepID=UPI00131AB106|nr:acetolactate synthase small subunit [Acidobacterium sp. S8]